MKRKLICMPSDYDHQCTWCAEPQRNPGYCSVSCAHADMVASERWGQIRHAKVAREYLRRQADKLAEATR